MERVETHLLPQKEIHGQVLHPEVVLQLPEEIESEWIEGEGRDCDGHGHGRRSMSVVMRERSVWVSVGMVGDGGWDGRGDDDVGSSVDSRGGGGRGLGRTSNERDGIRSGGGGEGSLLLVEVRVEGRREGTSGVRGGKGRGEGCSRGRRSVEGSVGGGKGRGEVRSSGSVDGERSSSSSVVRRLLLLLLHLVEGSCERVVSVAKRRRRRCSSSGRRSSSTPRKSSST